MEDHLPSITEYGLSYCPRCGNGAMLPVVDRFTDPNTKQKRTQLTLVCVGESACTHQIANPSRLEDYLTDDALAKVQKMVGARPAPEPSRHG